MEVLTKSEAETFSLGRSLAGKLRGGEALLLSGELGAGKTVFTKGLAAGLGIAETITSPTYVFLRSYRGPQLTLYHLDLYRIGGVGEADRIIFDDILADPRGIFAVEWPDFFPLKFFKVCYRVNFIHQRETERLIKIEPNL